MVKCPSKADVWPARHNLMRLTPVEKAIYFGQLNFEYFVNCLLSLSGH